MLHQLDILQKLAIIVSEMIIYKSFRFRIYPNKDQQDLFAKTFGCCRFVYNHFLRQRIDHYAEQGKGLSYYDTSKLLTELKRDDEYNWLCDVSSQSLQQSLRDLATAYTNFFKKRSRFPRFKSKRARQSFRVPQRFRVEDGKLYIPKITSGVKIVIHHTIEGAIKYITVSKTPSGKYFASLTCEVEIPDPEYNGGVIGIDLGLKDFIVTSKGERVKAPKFFRNSERRLKRLQRQLSRRKKGSKGWGKARLALANQHERVSNQRKDFLHKLSRRLVDENQVIHAESLAVKNMMRNHCLAKSIADAGWGEFIRQLSYKGDWYGCQLNQIDRFFPSSKRCHHCGYIHGLLRLSDRQWACPECGAIHDRDENAAINIELFGTAGAAGIHAGGDGRAMPSLKPEA